MAHVPWFDPASVWGPFALISNGCTSGGWVDVPGIAEMKGGGSLPAQRADIGGTCHLPVDAVTQALTLTDVSLCTSPPCVTVMGGPRCSVHFQAP